MIPLLRPIGVKGWGVLCAATLLSLTTAFLAACDNAPNNSVTPSISARLRLQDAKDIVLGADVRVSMVGDIMLGGTATEIYQKHGYPYAFAQTRHILRRADIVFGNLEGPLAEWGVTDPSKTYSFKSDPRQSASALRYGGFDIVSLANNHALDYGIGGMWQTTRALDDAGIVHVGSGMNADEARRARIVEVGNAKIAFLGYSLVLPETFWATDRHGGVAFGDQEHIVADVKAARKRAGIVLVSIHWGQESTTKLRPYQEMIGRAAIDAGASVVIGHHPHVLQAIEPYKQGVILYSLGNFAFGSYSKKVDYSVIAQAYFKQQKLIQLRVWPIHVRNDEVLFQSKILDTPQADEVIETLREISADHGADIFNDNGTGVLFF